MHGLGPWLDSACSGMEKQRCQFLGVRWSKVHRPMLFHDPSHLNDPVRLKICFQQHQFILWSLANGLRRVGLSTAAKRISITLVSKLRSSKKSDFCDVASAWNLRESSNWKWRAHCRIWSRLNPLSGNIWRSRCSNGRWVADRYFCRKVLLVCSVLSFFGW